MSPLAAAFDMAALLHEATTGNRAVQVGVQASVFRIESIYEEASDAYWVDALVIWPEGPCSLTINASEPHVHYDVQAYFVHRHSDGGPVSMSMSVGHYISYLKHGPAWYLADDEQVKELTEPPTELRTSYCLHAVTDL